MDKDVHYIYTVVSPDPLILIQKLPRMDIFYSVGRNISSWLEYAVMIYDDCVESCVSLFK